MLVVVFFALALVAMLLVAAHLSRHRRVRFEVSVARLLSISLEVDGAEPELGMAPSTRGIVTHPKLGRGSGHGPP